MDVEIVHGPGNAAAKVTLKTGERLTTEGGAMIAMRGDLSVETTTHKRGSGSIGRALKRMLARESLFLNHYSAGSDGGEVWLASSLAGDMLQYDLDEETLIVQGGSFVACESGIDLDMGWQGFRSLFAGENLFWVQLRGKGKVILSSFGAIYPIQIKGSHIVDSGHIVAFNETLRFSLSKAGKSWLSSFLGGEGLVCKFEGEGMVWCQSHNSSAFGRLLGPMLRPR